MPRKEEDQLFSRLRSQNYYDCVNILDPSDMPSSVQIFGNRNIGNEQLTNLHVPGQLGNHEGSFVIQRWYARTNIPDVAPILRIWGHSTQVTFIMGSMPQWLLSVAELLDRRPRTDEARPVRLADGDPWPIILPTRQYIRAQINNYGSSLEELRGWLRKRPPFQEPGINPYLWIHFEGLVIPSSSLFDTARLFEVLMRDARKRGTVAEEIATWITGLSNDPTISDDTKATMAVISDGIQEGRYKG